MRPNSLKTKQADSDVPATRQSPKPGDFALGSAESRAAARAMLGKPKSPRPGDVVVEIEEPWLPILRASEIYRIPGWTAPDTAERPSFNLDYKIFFKFPKGFDRPTSTKVKHGPASREFWDHLTTEFLDAVLRAGSPLCEPSGYRDVQIFRDDTHSVPVAS